VHGVVVSTEPIDLARIALARLGLVGKGDERDRRPTQDELDRIVSALEANIRQQIPVGRIIRFAVATAMRLGSSQSLSPLTATSWTFATSSAIFRRSARRR